MNEEAVGEHLMVDATPWTLYTQERDPVPIVKEAG